MNRIAIVIPEKCKPNKCNLECKKSCPVNKTDKQCIVVSPTSTISVISELLCVGCNICVKKCPFNAITIVNLPKSLANEETHRYGQNLFKLHKLPIPKSGQVLGLLGSNGTGKTTVMKILSGILKPNLGNFTNEPTWDDIIKYYRGSELQNYFTKIVLKKDGESRSGTSCVIKPQYVDNIAKSIGAVKVIDALKSKDNNKEAKDKDLDNFIKEMDLLHLLNRNVCDLSGGELQRFAITMILIQKADVYMFDEFTSYLDIKQRLQAAALIRDIIVKNDKAYVICIEHDMSILDYLSDQICILYGQPGAYGIVSNPYSSGEGLNIFLGGYIPSENVRFRDYDIHFKFGTLDNVEDKTINSYDYPEMHKKLGSDVNEFNLKIEAGNFKSSEIIVCLGENGGGKTTFIRMLAGLLFADKPETDTKHETVIHKMSVSLKPQKIMPKFPGTVRELFQKKITKMFTNDQFKIDVLGPMNIESFIDQKVLHLSGGELQRVAIIICLGTPANIYLIDEPSAYLDSEQRINVSKIIKRFIFNNKKTCFVVEHDFIMSTYLADRVIVFEGKPGLNMIARAPQNLLSGMNLFLKNLGITFRRDPTNNRPRINKKDSIKDQEQKKSGNYFNE